VSWRDYRGKYDVNDFIVPPEFGKGKSMQISCRIQAAHYRLLNIVARSGHFPFEERPDVIRWCIKFGLEHIDSLEPSLTRSVISQANIMNRRNQEILAEMKFQEWLNTSKEVLGGYVSRGDEESAREEVRFMYEQIIRMPDEPDRSFRWKCKYLDTMRANFGRYLDEEEKK
jgi:hypothetical protein